VSRHCPFGDHARATSNIEGRCYAMDPAGGSSMTRNQH